MPKRSETEPAPVSGNRAPKRTKTSAARAEPAPKPAPAKAAPAASRGPRLAAVPSLVMHLSVFPKRAHKKPLLEREKSFRDGNAANAHVNALWDRYKKGRGALDLCELYENAVGHLKLCIKGRDDVEHTWWSCTAAEEEWELAKTAMSPDCDGTDDDLFGPESETSSEYEDDYDGDDNPYVFNADDLRARPGPDDRSSEGSE